MKTNIRTSLLVFVFLIGAVIPACAQWEKALTKGGSTLSKASQQMAKKGTSGFLRKIPGTKRYVYPQHTVEQLKTQLFPRVENATKRAALSAKIAPKTPPKVELKPYDVLAGHTPQQSFLSLIETENSFYQEEISLAEDITNTLKHRASLQKPLNDQETIAIIEKLSSIQNDHLRLELYRNLLAGDLPAMVRDLSDYFTLDKPFEEAALDYMVRNPHKRNLRTLRLLHNPFIAESFKTPIKKALGKTSLTAQEQEALKEAFKAINEEYKRILTQIKQEHQVLIDEALVSEVIQDKLMEYEKTFDAIEKFVAINGHLPRWQSRSAKERALNVQASHLSSVELAWPFEPFLSKRKELETLLKKYEPNRRSLQETIEAFTRFVKETGRPYPRMIDEGLDVSEAEWQLWDDLLYWRVQNFRTIKKIEEIQRQHSIPLENANFYE